MFIIAQSENGIWISELTQDGYKEVSSPDFDGSDLWGEWKECDSVESCLDDLAKELKLDNDEQD